MQWLLVLIAMASGAALAAQAGVNAALGRWIGNPVQASLASFTVGSIGLLTFSLLARPPWPGVERLWAAPIWVWSGGLLGALYVVAAVIIAPKLGASAMIGSIIAGQMLASVLLDHFGLIGFTVHPISPLRVVGIALLIGGVVLIRNS